MKTKIHDRGNLIKDYLGKQWQLPVTLPHWSKKREVESEQISDTDTLSPKVAKMDAFTKEVANETIEKLAQETSVLRIQICDLTQENSRLLKENQKLSSQLLVMKQKLRLYNPKKVNQTLKRKGNSLYTWKNKYRTLAISCSKTIKGQKELCVLKKSLSLMKVSKKKQSERYKEGKKKRKCVTNIVIEKVSSDFISQLTAKQKQLKQAQEEIRSLEVDLDNTNCREQDEPVQTKKDGKTFRHGIREACYHLQNVGVSQGNISAALRKVTKAVTGQELGNLPSYGSQNKMTKEMKALSRQQVKEALHGAKETTLKYDGTTKKVGHLVEVEISTKEQTFLVGLREQAGGKATDYVETILDSMNAIEATPDSRDTNLHILKEVTNTMTDRCVTNAAIDRQLEEVKGSGLNQFKCAMHPLDSMAKYCDKEIRIFETNIDLESKKKTGRYPFMSRGESITQSVVRTAAKLFHDTKFNCDIELVKYLKNENKVPQSEHGHSVLYPRFVGNRFHIYFLCCGTLFHYTKGIVEFFTTVYPPKNDVHHAVLNAIQLEDLPVSLRALGLIGKLITAPWMRLVGEDKTILEMNTYFTEAKTNLTKWTENAAPLLLPDPPSIFASIPVKRDEVLISLLQPTSNNPKTVHLLQKLCGACLHVVQNQLSTQLPGGIFYDPMPVLISQAESCASTNISGERNFAVADHEITRARRAQPGYIEAKTMFKVNKTGTWLAEKSDDERKRKVEIAMKEGRHIEADDKERRKKMDKIISDRLQKSRKNLLEKEDKEREKVEKLVEDVFENGGLWQDEPAVNKGIEKMSKTKTVAALMCQINARTKLLKCKSNEKVTLGKCSVLQLKDHLIELMKVPVPDNQVDLALLLHSTESLVHSLKGFDLVQRWIAEDGKVQWYEGKFTDYIQENNEFRLEYEDKSVCFLTPGEIVVDIHRGDLDVRITSEL